MGNLPLSTGLFKTDGTISEPLGERTFVARRICSGVIYYYVPVTEAVSQRERSARDSSNPAALSISDSETPSPAALSRQNLSSSSRPLLLFFSWLGAQPGGVAKYRDLYLDRGMDVLLVQSSVMHFLWPRWGLDYGSEVLNILAEPPFSGRDVLVHASSIGGYTFTQILVHITREPKKHAGFTQRVRGHIYDSLVVGTLEDMATGLGKTLVPRLECFIKNTAMLYFWLFKTHTADFYESGVQVFYKNPITSPTLFFFSENDALCNSTILERLMDFWRCRGVSVDSRKWTTSTHAAHLRCHPEDYLSALHRFLNSVENPSLTTEM